MTPVDAVGHLLVLPGVSWTSINSHAPSCLPILCLSGLGLVSVLKCSEVNADMLVGIICAGTLVFGARFVGHRFLTIGFGPTLFRHQLGTNI